MKKMYLFLVVIALMLSVVSISDAETTLYNSTKSTFLTAVSTTSTTGRFIANTVKKTRIQSITVSWDVTSSTGTFILYDNLKGSSSTEIFRVHVPSGTVAPNYLTIDYPIGMPKIADYGLLGICDGGRNVACVIEYR